MMDHRYIKYLNLNWFAIWWKDSAKKFYKNLGLIFQFFFTTNTLYIYKWDKCIHSIVNIQPGHLELLIKKYNTLDKQRSFFNGPIISSVSAISKYI